MSFDKNLGIDEIIEDAYERIGMQGVSGYQLKTAKRSLNILFSEWGNRGLQFWEVKKPKCSFSERSSSLYFL